MCFSVGHWDKREILYLSLALGLSDDRSEVIKLLKVAKYVKGDQKPWKDCKLKSFKQCQKKLNFLNFVDNFRDVTTILQIIFHFVRNSTLQVGLKLEISSIGLSPPTPYRLPANCATRNIHLLKISNEGSADLKCFRRFVHL